MQEGQTQDHQPTIETTNPTVGFPGKNDTSSSNGGKKLPKIIIAVLGVIIIVSAGGFFVFKVATKSDDGTTPDDSGQSLGTFATPYSDPDPTNTPDPTTTPEPADKEGISIEVLNGTGKAGQAGFVQKELEKLGFEDIEVGNADDQDADRTIVTFSRSLSKLYVDEITKMLEKNYKDVSTRKGTLAGGLSVRIVTGTVKDNDDTSDKPAETASPKPDSTE